VILQPALWLERMGRATVILVLTLPAVSYQSWLIKSDALYAAKAMTPTPTPPLPTMLLSYGLLIPLAVVGAVYGLRRRHVSTLFLTCWVTVHGLCIYLPVAWFPFQRKMIEGLHVPLGLLAATGLWIVARWLGAGLAALRHACPASPTSPGAATAPASARVGWSRCRRWACCCWSRRPCCSSRTPSTTCGPTTAPGWTC